ncbi:hypothetical protein GCM10023116_46510 [Kistimonas scapharcae]|uniref:HTH luxR-type domain-containing protein n=2 Tax=Kistimonas scapharcae TaxID=1036133 RepID=A0ABP8VBM5_9GAMM
MTTSTTIRTELFEALPNPWLTQRETEVLAQIAQGRKQTELAEVLGVSVETARTYIGRVSHKLGVSDKAHAVCTAFCLGILKPLCLLLVVTQIVAAPASDNPSRPVRTTPRVVRVVRSGRNIRELAPLRAA